MSKKILHLNAYSAPWGLYIHFFANICIMNVYLMLLDPSSKQLGAVPSVLVKYHNESTSSSLQLASVPTVSFQSHNETIPNSQQLGYSINSFS
jgi:hypothetical protein